jgi:glutamine synthetase
VFSEHTITHYVDSKRAEIADYRKQVHDWEVRNYLVKY